MFHGLSPGLKCCYVILSTALDHVNNSLKSKAVTIKVVTTTAVTMMQLERIRFTKSQ